MSQLAKDKDTVISGSIIQEQVLFMESAQKNNQTGPWNLVEL